MVDMQTNRGQTCKQSFEPNNFSFLFILQFRRIIFEEVDIQESGNTQQDIGIDGRSIENLIDVRTAIRHLFREPHHRTALVLQFLLDELTNMHTSSRLCRRFPHPAFYIIRYNEITKKRRRESSSLLIPSIQALALPFRKDKQRKSAHACMIYIDTTEQTDSKSVRPAGIQSYHVDAFVAVISF